MGSLNCKDEETGKDAIIDISIVSSEYRALRSSDKNDWPHNLISKEKPNGSFSSDKEDRNWNKGFLLLLLYKKKNEKILHFRGSG